MENDNFINDSDENSILNEINISNYNKYQGKNSTKFNSIIQNTTKIWRDSHNNTKRKSVDFFCNKNLNEQLKDNYNMENYNIRSFDINNSLSNFFISIIFNLFFRYFYSFK
jgi:hypothetical protein